MTAAFLLLFNLLLISPPGEKEKCYTGKQLSEEKEIHLKKGTYTSLFISHIYANQIWITTGEQRGTGERVVAATREQDEAHRNSFRLDLETLDSGTYFIQTTACYAAFTFRLIID